MFIQKVKDIILDGLLELRCKIHPTYTGARKPRVKCKGCDFIFEDKQRKKFNQLNPVESVSWPEKNPNHQ